jgi:hypothetical protein
MHPAQASRGDLTAITSYDPLRVDGRVVRRSTHHGRWSRRLVCPLVLGVYRRLRLRGSPDHVSALSRPGTSPGIRPVVHGDQLEGLAQLPWFPAAFPPPAFASWSSFARQRVGPSSRSAYRPVNTGRTQTGVSTFRTHELRPGWVPSIPRGRRCSPGTITSPRLPHLNGTSLDPATTIHRCEALLDEASTRVHAIHPSGLPLACGSRMEREPLGFPPSSTPRDYSQRTSGWGQAIEHGPETTLYVIDVASNLASLLNACDLVSHSWLRKSRRRDRAVVILCLRLVFGVSLGWAQLPRAGAAPRDDTVGQLTSCGVCERQID